MVVRILLAIVRTYRTRATESAIKQMRSGNEERSKYDEWNLGAEGISKTQTRAHNQCDTNYE